MLLLLCCVVCAPAPASWAGFGWRITTNDHIDSFIRSHLYNSRGHLYTNEKLYEIKTVPPGITPAGIIGGITMSKAEIENLLETKIHEIFSEIQTRENIENGDILPGDAIELNEIAETLAGIIERVTRYQMEEIQ